MSQDPIVDTQSCSCSPVPRCLPP